MGMHQKAMQPISGQFNQYHKKGHGRFGRSIWGPWCLHKKRWSYDSTWGNGKRNHPGLHRNIMNRPTVCFSRISKEPQNITGLVEPPGEVETEDSFQYGK
jgi:hypothetical protein